MENSWKKIALNLTAFIVSIAPPLVATLHQFPVWTIRSAEATISGIVVFLAILCFVPLYKKILQSFKTPSAPLMWGVLAVLMYVMKSIAAEMFVVAVIGTASNTIGCFLFKMARKYSRRE